MDKNVVVRNYSAVPTLTLHCSEFWPFILHPYVSNFAADVNGTGNDLPAQVGVPITRLPVQC